MTQMPVPRGTLPPPAADSTAATATVAASASFAAPAPHTQTSSGVLTARPRRVPSSRHLLGHGAPTQVRTLAAWPAVGCTLHVFFCPSSQFRFWERTSRQCVQCRLALRTAPSHQPVLRRGQPPWQSSGHRDSQASQSRTRHVLEPLRPCQYTFVSSLQVAPRISSSVILARRRHTGFTKRRRS